jgi:hypothetical protein
MRNLTPQPPSLQGKGEQEFPSPRSRSDRSFSEDEEGVRGEVLPGGKPSLTLALNEKPNPSAPVAPPSLQGKGEQDVPLSDTERG